MWSLAGAELQHRCRNCFAINYKQSVYGQFKPLFQIPELHIPAWHGQTGVSVEGSRSVSGFGEKTLLWGEKPRFLARETIFHALFIVWEWHLGKGNGGLSWELLIVGVINLFNLLVSIGWAPGAFRHQVVLALGHMIAKAKLLAWKELDPAGGSSPVALL